MLHDSNTTTSCPQRPFFSSFPYCVLSAPVNPTRLRSITQYCCICAISPTTTRCSAAGNCRPRLPRCGVLFMPPRTNRLSVDSKTANSPEKGIATRPLRAAAAPLPFALFPLSFHCGSPRLLFLFSLRSLVRLPVKAHSRKGQLPHLQLGEDKTNDIARRSADARLWKIKKKKEKENGERRRKKPTDTSMGPPVLGPGFTRFLFLVRVCVLPLPVLYMNKLHP